MAISSASAISRLSKSWPAAAVVVTALALGGISAGLGNPDLLVTSGFETALKTREAAGSRIARTIEGSSLVQLSGSEEFWLNARTPAAHAVQVALDDSLRRGDLVTFGSGTSERRYEVVDIRAVGDSGSAAGRAAADFPVGRPAKPAVPLMLVTCRDTADPEAAPVRFVIERGDMSAGTARRTPRAL